MYKVFIDGSHGTTGLRIFSYLCNRNDITLLNISDKDRKDINARLNMISESDISFLCLPDEASKEIVPLIPHNTKVIDTSTAFRTDPSWIYGMPELNSSQKELIRNSNRVANPGCHASGFILAVKPLVSSGLLPKDALLSATSLTGYSGGGKQMIRNYEESPIEEYKSGAAYGLTQNHKHLPEMMVATGIKCGPTFIPIVGNYFNGMEVSVPLHKEQFTSKVTISEILNIFTNHYENCPLIKIHGNAPEIGFIYSNQLANSNTVNIYIHGNEDRPVITALYDNLGKGASGAAVQNMNIMLGLDETLGLL